MWLFTLGQLKHLSFDASLSACVTSNMFLNIDTDTKG